MVVNAGVYQALSEIFTEKVVKNRDGEQIVFIARRGHLVFTAISQAVNTVAEICCW